MYSLRYTQFICSSIENAVNKTEDVQRELSIPINLTILVESTWLARSRKNEKAKVERNERSPGIKSMLYGCTGGAGERWSWLVANQD